MPKVIQPRKTRQASALCLLGACRWTGRASPLGGSLRGSVPDALRSFAGGEACWLAGVFPSDLTRLRQAAGSVGTGPGLPVEYRLVTEDAGVVWVRHWFSVRPGASAGELEGTIQVVDEQKALEAECIRVCERERATIGQELHDDVCQLLAGLAAMMRALDRKIHSAESDAHVAIGELIELLVAGMGRARSLAHGLVLLRLGDGSSVSALSGLAKDCAARFKIEVPVRFSRSMPAHDPDQLTHIYRIAQEAIGNAVNHGRASRVDLHFRAVGRKVRLTVRDNGSGIPAKELRPVGLGLHIMSYRASSLGGMMRVAAGRRGGTTLTVDYECRTERPTKTRVRS